MITVWATNNSRIKGSMIAKVKKFKEGIHSGLSEVEILKFFYKTGAFANWLIGSVITLTEEEIKDEKGTIKFIFEGLKY